MRVVALVLTALLGLVRASPIGPDSMRRASSSSGSFESTTLTTNGRGAQSFSGYLNGGSFQQDAIVTHGSRQYVVFWDDPGHVNVGRRDLPSGAWDVVTLADYTTTSTDSHNTISLGICHEDGTLHLAFDMHASELRYRRSVAGLLDADEWSASSWGAVQTHLGTGAAAVSPTAVTYPTFVRTPDGALQLSLRHGIAAAGDEWLFEYSGRGASDWEFVGPYIAGAAAKNNAYLFGLLYDDTGRLHAAWTTRFGADPSTNQDIFYAISEDRGRTWKSQAGVALGTAGSGPVSSTSADAKVVDIPQNRGLINQESMLVDGAGFVHIVASHLPADAPDNPDWTAARADAVLVHYWLDPRQVSAGAAGWSVQYLGVHEGEFRADIGVDADDNLYVVSGNSNSNELRVSTATKTSAWARWRTDAAVLDPVFDSDPLLDRPRLRAEGVASVFAVRTGGRELDVLSWEGKLLL